MRAGDLPDVPPGKFNPQISQIYTEGFTAVSNHQMSQLLTPLDFGLSRAGPRAASINQRASRCARRAYLPQLPLATHHQLQESVQICEICGSLKSPILCTLSKKPNRWSASKQPSTINSCPPKLAERRRDQPSADLVNYASVVTALKSRSSFLAKARNSSSCPIKTARRTAESSASPIPGTESGMMSTSFSK
jgi:hypothetical protein